MTVARKNCLSTGRNPGADPRSSWSRSVFCNITVLHNNNNDNNTFIWSSVGHTEVDVLFSTQTAEFTIIILADRTIQST